MKRPVLIVTASLELGELISKSLAETYQFDPVQVRDQASATAFLLRHPDCTHALLETALGDARLLELARALRTVRRNLKLILISRSMPSARLDQIRPWSLLRQPFLLPDLLAALEAVKPTIIDVDSVPGSGSRRASWLDDPALAVETLERLAAASNIQEVILLRKSDVWAYAGRLSRDAVREIQDLVLRNIDLEQDFDLLRYMRLTSRDDQHGLWAKLLLANMILAVIYDLNTSFAEMRQQTNALADALSRPALAQPPEPESRGLSTVDGRPAARRRTIRMQPSSRSRYWRQLGLSAPRRPMGEASEPPSPRTPLRRQDVPLSGPEFDNLDQSGDMGTSDSRGLDSLTDYLRSQSDTFRDSRDPTPDSSLPQTAPSPDESSQLDAPRIPYSCVLTPRFESSRLTTDLAGILRGVLPQICISYGWWLDFLEVMVDCLHWVAILPPTETVAAHVQTVRRLTSACLLDAFPEYFRENFSKDFWAPGYSVRAGSQGHTALEIQSYVTNYRVHGHRYPGWPPSDSDRSSGSNRG